MASATRAARGCRSVVGILIAGLALFAGCASAPQGYPGPSRSWREIASVRGILNPVRYQEACNVAIAKVNGMETFHGFSGPKDHVELLPGSYELELLLKGPYGGPLALQAIRPFMDEEREDDRHRTITLSVEAGHRYYLAYDWAGAFYTIRTEVVGEKQPTPRELAAHDPGLARCEQALTPLDHERCVAWLQE